MVLGCSGDSHAGVFQVRRTAGSTVNKLMPHACIRVWGRVLPQEDPRMRSLFGMQSQECRGTRQGGEEGNSSRASEQKGSIQAGGIDVSSSP